MDTLRPRHNLGTSLDMRSQYQWNNIGYAVGWILFLGHFLTIVSYAVNIPYMDEWGGSSFAVGHQTEEFNPSFIFAFHNEHRIIFTKLEVWLMHHLIGLNFIALIAIHYLMYAGLCWWLVRSLEKTWDIPLSAAFVALSSTLAHENHITAFQGQFHYVIGFFLIAVTLLFSEKKPWASPLLMIASIYSMGFGVTFGAIYILSCLVMAYESPKDKKKLLLYSIIVTLALSLWFIGRPESKIASTPAVIFTKSFWDFLFLLFINGFGLVEIPIWWGGILFGILSLCIIATTLKIFSQDSTVRIQYWSLFFPLIGLLLGLTLVAYGRVSLGLEGALASRYCEVIQFLIPYIIVLISLTGMYYSSISNTKLLAPIISLLILIPLLDNYNFPDTYKSSREERLRTVQCVKRYIRGKNDGVCPIPIQAQLGPHIDYGRELNLPFFKQ